jgi:hypothetical protein
MHSDKGRNGRNTVENGWNNGDYSWNNDNKDSNHVEIGPGHDE